MDEKKGEWGVLRQTLKGFLVGRSFRERVSDKGPVGSMLYVTTVSRTNVCF